MADGQDVEHREVGTLLRESLKSQYRAALGMLRQSVEQCPDRLWVAGDPPFWKVAYHTAFYAHFYMGTDVAAFRPWELHRPRMEAFGAAPESLGEPYTRNEVLAYLSQIDEMVGPAVDALDLTAQDCGFPWYKVAKVEHQMINLRHIQHHTIYLSATLRASGEEPVKWVSPGKSFGRSTGETR